MENSAVSVNGVDSVAVPVTVILCCRQRGGARHYIEILWCVIMIPDWFLLIAQGNDTDG